ncbi:PEP-CTERM sorting domain-containing protein [Massilia pinisoli]|uniref:PEP-CTERM sorting domain-containing protein n=1 Tax=Massilia pinisoli TaxID=1772194 RepID=A0ABT1ZZG0_9BURK|nr:PEP-CTERM sorting domain-containing protein [Massilia pinisoli]MCS0585317.1 PEP-CTERM sorting domain-containing protein [Massilia pinisoli]
MLRPSSFLIYNRENAIKLRDLFRTLSVACTVAITAQASATPTLLVDANGILTGAKNVNVAGKRYDVSFMDGSCNSLFDRCANSAFAFHTTADGRAAGQALLDQVFIDGSAGAFDSVTTHIRGCTDGFQCETLIPIYLPPGLDQVQTAYVRNFTGSYIDAVEDYVYMVIDVDTTPVRDGYNGFGYPQINWAVFRQSADGAAVPEPSSVALIGVAMAGLVFSRRRKSKNRR